MLKHSNLNLMLAECFLITRRSHVVEARVYCSVFTTPAYIGYMRSSLLDRLHRRIQRPYKPHGGLQVVLPMLKAALLVRAKS